MRTAPRVAPAAPAGSSAGPAPHRTALPGRWVAPGERVQVGPYTLPDGMIYTGQELPAVTPWRGTEPALINPGLSLSSDRTAIRAAEAGYWPAYHQVTPAFRTRYLEWLAGGRRNPDTPMGCVFLFFYGIERRLLADGETGALSAAEVGTLVGEVERLLLIYGENRSFQRYASSLLEFVAVRHGSVDDDLAQPPAEGGNGDLPLSLRARLGRFAVQRQPIPAEWALAWVHHTPQISLRTAATRCPEEFASAFRHLYRARFGEGMTLKANRTALSLTYHPASASFGGPLKLEIPGLPDVGVLSAPVDRLRQIADAATEAIDRYSRWVGRAGEGESLPALTLLPAEVLRGRVRRSTPPLVAELAGALEPGAPATIPSSMLVRHWPAARADKLSRKEAEGLSEFLEKLGMGIAPDVRHTGMNPTQAPHAAVFLLPGEAPVPGPDFGVATLMLTLAAAVAGADGISGEEEEQIAAHLESAYGLHEADRARLRAHLAWLRVCPPNTTGLKKQLAPLPSPAREAMARALIAIAGADGHVSPAEVKMLSRLYPLLGLDAKRVYADVHALAAAPGPVTVLSAETAEEFVIPRPAPAAIPAAGFALDIARITAIQHETREVTAVLAGVFADPEPEPAAAPSPPPPAEEHLEAQAPAADHLPGLDAAHSSLVRALGDRMEIASAEFAALAEERGLIAGGAMESINDAAFQLCDEPLLEGADPIEINPYARQELFA